MRHAAIHGNWGFSLVEALVAGIISIFVLLTAITVFNMNTKQIAGSFVRSVTKMQYQTVIDQIGKNVRLASSVGLHLPDTGAVVSPSDTIWLFDSLGARFAGYVRSGTALMEWHETQFINFTVGSKTIQVLDVGTNNTFTIAPTRRSVTLNLNVFGVNGTVSDTMRSSGETFVCRNY